MPAMNTIPPPTDWREGCRLRAWDLHQQGWPQKQIAVALGVTQGAVSQWIAHGRAGGADALRNRSRKGATPKLTQEQRERLPDLLKRGAEAYGFVGDVWTRARIATVIKREFGVRYHPGQMGVCCTRLAGVCRSQLSASERNDAAIECWRTEKWSAIKNSRTRGPYARLDRRSRVLPAAGTGAYLGACRRAANHARAV